MNWEYWPFEVVYIPVMFYWLWLSVKARSPFFFSASNPGIEYGGMLGESKIKILDKIEEDLKPKTLFFESQVDESEVIRKIQEAEMKYPLIFKPDVGERGMLVEKIEDDQQTRRYVGKIDRDFLIQEFVDLPIELGVFYFRYPNRKSGRVSSIVVKDFLKVIGDGKSSIRQLILKNPRAKLQLDTLTIKYGPKLNEVLAIDEEKLLVPIGNHCKGATFLDGGKHINRKMTKSFDRIAAGIEGFYIGRFDIKCASWEDLNDGKIKIMELNGAGAEPAHIYQPGASLWKGYQSLFYHMRALLRISRINRRAGVPYMSWKEGWYVFKQLPTFKKMRLS